MVSAWCRQIFFFVSHFSKPFVSLVKQLELECTWNCFMVHQVRIPREASFGRGYFWTWSHDKYWIPYIIAGNLSYSFNDMKTKRMLRNPKLGKTLFLFSLISAIIIHFDSFLFCLPLRSYGKEREKKKTTAKYCLWIFENIRSSLNHGNFNEFSELGRYLCKL